MDALFDKGVSYNAYPIKLVCISAAGELEYPAQAMFVAPKRSFKRAHDRNKLKRRMREAYRLNKSIFYEGLKSADKKMAIAFIYIGKKQEEYTLIEAAMQKLMNSALKIK